MVEQYSAIALQTTTRNIETRADCKRNLDHICKVMKSAYMMGSLEFPVKLITLGEGAIQGFTDSIFDWDHVKAARELHTTVPGEETAILAEKAREFQCYIIGQVRAREPEFEDRFFNIAFIIDPRGEIIHKYHKLQMWPYEHSLTPHDVWDKWVELYGADLNAFYPVADTEIGKIGTLVCMDGSYPETARGLALNGAEIIYRSTYPEPWVGFGWWEVQNRARALDNSCYLIAPSIAGRYQMGDDDEPLDVHGHSMVVDYMGNVSSKRATGGPSYVVGLINIEALREYREKVLFGNWLKDLRTEQYRLMYDQPIYPKNLYLNEPPGKRPERIAIYRRSIEALKQRGIYTPTKRKG